MGGIRHILLEDKWRVYTVRIGEINRSNRRRQPVIPGVNNPFEPWE
jgi:hypothetical protein